ncbi:MAG: sulfotransferase [Planctomycetota bacterium]
MIMEQAKLHVRQNQEPRAFNLLLENFKGNEENFDYLMLLGSLAVTGSSKRWLGPKVARRFTESALRLRPEDSKARYWAAAARRQDGDVDGAIELFQQLIEKGEVESLPGGSAVYSSLAEALRFAGRAQDAYELLKARYSTTASIGIRWIFGEAAYRVGELEEAEEAFLSVVNDSNSSMNNRQGAWFSLAALYGKQKRFDEAMEAVHRGHRMDEFGFNREKFEKTMTRGMELFSQEKVPAHPKASLKSERPVFVLGMPRSGTTLLEQILDMHPQVVGAGELAFITHCANRLEGRRFTASDSILTKDRNLTRPKLDSNTKYYLESIAEIDLNARYVVDKMPGNFLHVGLISLMFPHSHVLHIMRDPRDNAVSYHMLNFQGQHPQAADLANLGYYYNKYRELMEHWKSVLDVKILEVKYEHLVVDNENWVHKILDFLDLPFDEACLRSHESQRTAMTASFEQVRQPIYTGSIGRWRRYEKHLQPFIDEVDPKYLAEWDQDELINRAVPSA